MSGCWTVAVMQCADWFDVTLSILPQHDSENIGVLSFFLSMTKLARDKQVDIFLGSLIDNSLEAYDAFGLPQDAGVDHQKRVWDLHWLTRQWEVGRSCFNPWNQDNHSVTTVLVTCYRGVIRYNYIHSQVVLLGLYTCVTPKYPDSVFAGVFFFFFFFFYKLAKLEKIPPVMIWLIDINYTHLHSRK